MARDISVSIAVQGEKEFNQALKNAQSAVKVLASELKASEAAFDENADAQAFYANKTRNINDQIEQQRTIMRSLEQAVREAGDEFGDASAKTDRYRIEINRTQASISKLEKELRETQREAEELGRDSTRVGRQIESGLGDAADDVSDKLDRMTEMLEHDLGEIGGAVKFSAVKDLGDMVIGALDGMASFVDETKETRLALSYLELNAEKAGLDFQTVKNLVVETTGITGELDGAFEGMNNLIGARLDTRELTEAVELLGGAVISFPETFKFEELASSMRETIKTGTATGQYAELLETLGVDLEEFNKAMAQATTEEERQQIALAALNKNGLEDLTKNMRESKENTVALNEAQTEYNFALADLATALEPAAIAWTRFKTSFVTGATEMVESINTWNTETKKNLEEGQSFWEATQADVLVNDIVEDYKEEIALEMGLYALALEALGYTFEGWIEDINEKAEDRKKKRTDLMKESSLGTALDWWSSLWVNTDSQKTSGPSAEEIQNTVDNAATQLEAAAEGKSAGFWGKFFGVSTAVAEEVDTAVGDLTTEIEEAAKGEEENMETIGENFAAQIGNGIADASDTVIGTALALWQGVKDVLTQKIMIPAPTIQNGSNATGTLKGGGNGMTGVSHTELVVQIDKTTVARATSGEINTLLGESAARAEQYG